MATLRTQLANAVTEFEPFERQANQECTILDRKMAPNGCGCEFILVDFVSGGHPYDAKGITVVVIEDGYLAEIDSQYVASIFNK